MALELKLRPGRLPEGARLTQPKVLLATWFGSGLAPFASGTWGSLAALPFAYAIHAGLGATALFLASLAMAALGVWASHDLSARAERHDPGFIVIDEVAGQWFTLAFAPLTWWGYAIGFVLFRAADVLKPWPARWCDRHVKGGVGVMADDMAAAVWSAAGTLLAAEAIARVLA